MKVRTTYKILQYVYYWPTILKDTHDYARPCDQRERQGLFGVCGIDFMVPFMGSQRIKYILEIVN